MVSGEELPEKQRPLEGAPIHHTVQLLAKQDGIYELTVDVSTDAGGIVSTQSFLDPGAGRQWHGRPADHRHRVGTGGCGQATCTRPGPLKPHSAAPRGQRRSPVPQNREGLHKGVSGAGRIIWIGSTRLVMSKIQPFRSHSDSADADADFGATTTTLSSQLMAGATTTLVRADARPVPENQGELHPQLKAQLRELRLRTGSADPDVPMLLRLINEHYQTIERERRGIVESMRLMADEAQALAHEAREQSSEHLQVILDHIKDVVLLVDAEGLIRTFNPTGERVFGYAEREVLGQRIDFLIPKIADDESIVGVTGAPGDPRR